MDDHGEDAKKWLYKRERERGTDDHGEDAKKWLYDMSRGVNTHELEAQTLAGIQIHYSHSGLFRCKFLIPSHLADGDGYWQAGAMAVLMDDVAAATICSVVGHIKVSVDFNISYLSRAKVQEEVDIEGKVVGHKGKLTLVEVRIKKSESGELVAFAKQWMASLAGGETITPNVQYSKL